MTRLETLHGSGAAAARAIGVSQGRWTKWRTGSFPEDAQLRCWLALTRPRTLKQFYREKGRQV